MALSLAVLVILLAPLAWGQQDVGAEARQEQGRWMVTWVDPGGGAARAGLRTGDVIVALDGAAPRRRRQTDPGLDLSRACVWGVLRHGGHLTLHPSVGGAAPTIALESILLLPNFGPN